MSEAIQDPSIESTDLTSTSETTVAPIAPLLPLEGEETTVAAPLDPITGNGYTNTSNGNQVAVLSTIDYSTTNVVYNYNLNASNETNSTSHIYGMSNTSQGSYQESTSDTADNSDITGNSSSSLQRNGYHLRFVSNDYFRTNGLRRVDRIMGFNGSNGDKLELSRRVFKGIGRMEFESVANNKKVKRVAKSDADIIYNESSGKLYFNANHDDKGFGAKGGLFAILESTPILSADQFIMI